MKSRKMKYGLSIIITIVAVLLILIPVSAQAENEITVYLNNRQLTFDVPPVMYNDRVMVPFRALGEAIGAEVEWIGEFEQVHVKKGNDYNVLAIGNDIAIKHNSIKTIVVQMDVPPYVTDGRTLVPLRYVAESLGLDVEWNDADQSVLLRGDGSTEGADGTTSSAANVRYDEQGYEAAIQLVQQIVNRGTGGSAEKNELFQKILERLVADLNEIEEAHEGETTGDTGLWVLNMLSMQTELEVQRIFVDDYDGDRLQETFAFAGSETDEGYVGELWFVDHEIQPELIIAEANFWGLGEIVQFGTHKFYVAPKYFTTGELVYVWGVEKGKAVEQNISLQGEGLQAVDNQNLILFQSAYDAYDMGDGIMVGHTWKKYYFYWDERQQSFYEYGALEVPVEKFIGLDGAADFLKNIEDSGAQVTGIFYRANGLININYVDSEESNENATMRYRSGAVELITTEGAVGATVAQSSYGGIYEAAMCPKLATYPEKLPF